MVGQKIKLIRNDRMLRQIDLANMVGVSQRSISGYELGEIVPSDVVLQRIASALGVGVDLLKMDDDMDVCGNVVRLRKLENDVKYLMYEVLRLSQGKAKKGWLMKLFER